jgi:CRISPR-associated endonuclease/helicase Cas3
MGPEDNDHEPLAHSPPRDGVPGDPYARHVNAVREGASKRAKAVLSCSSKPPSGLLKAIETAAMFHDLGKLDLETQNVLRKNRRSKLKWDHIDAGVAHLADKDRQDWIAAWLVRAHHSPGLPKKAEHFTDEGRRLRGRRRDDAKIERHCEQIAHTDELIEKYLVKHEAAVGPFETEKRKPVHGLTMRLALSCLVDADHSDSAFFDTGHVILAASDPRWSERLHSLCNYVRSLPRGESDAERVRNHRRREFFEACLASNIQDSIVACEGPVGLGKTTAVAAYLIRRAHEEGLRHLFIVAPFTNILSQTAERLRKALVLPGEQPDQIVVEHHHRADFSHRDYRALAVLWRAPIVLTTAVSFFETLAACNPAALRKFHEVPGSAIFLDEAHAALPTRLWRQNWKWVNELANHWGCRFVFASGSLARFWEHNEIIDKPVRLPELLPVDQASEVLRAERRRVKFAQTAGGRVLTVDELIEFVKKTPGPRLVIVNTVQNAAVVADRMLKSGMSVLHLSTALTPYDRETVLRRVRRKLKFGVSPDWTLVATSCVEAGVDLSFQCAFRERFSAASIIQVGGRVNRHGEYDDFNGGVVYDFALSDEGITQHPAASVSADVLRRLMDDGKLNSSDPADAVTQAMRDELRICGGLHPDLLSKAESERNYPEVAQLGRVISTDTRFVVIDPDLKASLKAHKPVDFNTLLQGSVQIWATRIEKLGLTPLNHKSRSPEFDVYEWQYDYDPDFLGYMKGVLKLEEFNSAGGAVI